MKTFKFPWNAASAIFFGLKPSPDLIVEREIDDDYATFLNECLPLLEAKRLEPSTLIHCVTNEPLKPGLIVEMGVWTGTTINYIAKQLPNRTIHGFDSFKGLPESWEGIPAGFFTRELPQVEPNVTLHVGTFAETLPSFVASHKDPIALLHCDADLYSSTKTALEFFAPQFQTGTIIVFDQMINVGILSALHEMLAWYEIVNERGINFEWIGGGFNSHLLFNRPEITFHNAAAVRIL